jgi:hypothetical protein
MGTPLGELVDPSLITCTLLKKTWSHNPYGIRGGTLLEGAAPGLRGGKLLGGGGPGLRGGILLGGAAKGLRSPYGTRVSRPSLFMLPDATCAPRVGL